jgi:archaellum component FlaC
MLNDAELIRMQKNFILNEGVESVDPIAYIQNVEELLNSVSIKTNSDSRRIAVAKENLKKIRKHIKRLQQEIAEYKSSI